MQFNHRTRCTDEVTVVESVVADATVVEGNHGGMDPPLVKRRSKKRFRVLLLMFFIWAGAALWGWRGVKSREQ